MISKDELNKFMQDNASDLSGALLPYPTADKIISEVLKNKEKSRENVMLMLLEYLSESIKNKTDHMEKLKIFLESKHR